MSQNNNPYRTGVPTSGYNRNAETGYNHNSEEYDHEFTNEQTGYSGASHNPYGSTPAPIDHHDAHTPQVAIRRNAGNEPPVPVLNFPETPTESPQRHYPTPSYLEPPAGPYQHSSSANTSQEYDSSQQNLFANVDTSYHSYQPNEYNRDNSLDGRLSPSPSQYDPWKQGPYADQNNLLNTNNTSNTFLNGSDLEAQVDNSHRTNVFGMPLRSPYGDGDEYADDEAGSYEQFPIRGDEYALNTWEDDSEMQSERDISRADDYSGDSEMDEDEKAIQARRVKLYKGNLVLDCPVSDKLLSQFPDHQPVREFTHMRYSAATSDPSEFGQDEFTLRQMCYSVPRQTELCIAITIYNEDDILLARTLQGVFNNIRHLCNRSRSKTWGAEAWKKVVVVVIADGRSKINPRSKALMAALGVYQEGFAKNMVNEKPVEAHIYEYTTMVRIAKVDNTVKLTGEKAVPVQMIFCLKEKNKKKINSHRWLFQAFCPILRPKVCVLLDAGTRPGNHAIYHLWKSFDKNPRVAGACGEIAAGLGQGYNKLLNPLVAAQNFEYKMSNILDKPSESVFGFITVLPGAFSAYRYEALLNDHNGIGPLEKYFKGEKLEADGGIFSSNMYLAEDRVLCWELVAKRHQNWVLKYVKAAKAHTDVPERLSELVLQRRRWLNGSFFASIYAQVHMFAIWGTSHSLLHKLAFHVEFLYQTITLIFSWFSLGNFFLVFKIITSALGDSSMHFAPGKVLSVVLTWVYGACLIATFVLSFGNRPKGTKWFYNLIVAFFAVLMAYIMFATIFIAVKSIQYTICMNEGFKPKLLVTDKTFRDLLISLLSTYALYLISSLLFLDPWHMLTSLVQYILLSPAYINVFNVYAFSNTHDISWGTKGDTAMKTDLGIVKADNSGKIEVELPTSSDLVDAQYADEINVLASPAIEEVSKPSPEDERSDYYALFRSSVVLIWGFMNIALVAVVLNIGGVENLMPSTSTSTGSTTTATTAGTAARAISGATKRSFIQILARAGTCEEVNTTSSRTTEIYLAVVLWSVAAMAAYRFIFALVYSIQRLFGR